MILYKVTSTGIKLIDSYKVGKRDMKPILSSLSYLEPYLDVWKRSRRSLCLEWAVHNALYAMGFQRVKTKDCDLNYPQKWYVRTAYWVVGFIVWPFIR